MSLNIYSRFPFSQQYPEYRHRDERDFFRSMQVSHPGFPADTNLLQPDEELHQMGIKVCVSVWPSVDKKSENFAEMNERGFLIRTERGGAQTYDYQGDCVEIDCTNPLAVNTCMKK